MGVTPQRARRRVGNTSPRDGHVSDRKASVCKAFAVGPPGLEPGTQRIMRRLSRSKSGDSSAGLRPMGNTSGHTPDRIIVAVDLSGLKRSRSNQGVMAATAPGAALALEIAVTTHPQPEVVDDRSHIRPPDGAGQCEGASCEHLRASSRLVVGHLCVLVCAEDVSDLRDDLSTPGGTRARRVRLDAGAREGDPVRKRVPERLPPLTEVALAASALTELRHGQREVGVEALKRIVRR